MRFPLVPMLAGLLAFLPANAFALRIIDHSVHVDAGAQSAFFAFHLDSIPDLFTLDQFGREQDAFQYWIQWTPSGDYFEPSRHPDVIIRGPEIRLFGAIPIRDASGDSSPGSGGWGPIRGLVPYEQDGPQFRFTVPLSVLGDLDGDFKYAFGVYRFGATTDERFGLSSGETPVDTRPSSWGRIKTLYR